MSHIDIEYENFKVYLSLSDKSILVSILNIINYDLYSIEIDQLIFNNYNLFVLLISGFKKFNPDIEVKLEVIDKKLNMILNIKNENTNFK
jgi:glycogen synthase